MLLLASVLPPLFGAARRYELAQTIQFCLLGFAVPALAVAGWPFARLRFRRTASVRRALEHLAGSRLRHADLLRALAVSVPAVGVMILWRLPPLVDALERHPWLLALEATSLVAAGAMLWLELLACPPFTPRVPHPRRAVVAAISMWALWIVSYAVGFSHSAWYPAFVHPTGGLGVLADQEIATGILWACSAAAFVPVVFFDLVAWLKVGEDPDAELRRLVRRERWLGPGD